MQRREENYRQMASEKMMIYSTQVATAKEIADEIDCSVCSYHAEGKGEVLAEIMAGEEEVIVTISALGMRVIITDIRAIAYVHASRTLLDYVQESDRAGRDGNVSRSVIIWDGGEFR